MESETDTDKSETDTDKTNSQTDRQTRTQTHARVGKGLGVSEATLGLSCRAGPGLLALPPGDWVWE